MRIYTHYQDGANTSKDHRTELYSYYHDSHSTSKTGAGIYSYLFKTNNNSRLKVDYKKPVHKLVLCFDGYSESYLGDRKLYAFSKDKAIFYKTLPAAYRSHLQSDTEFKVVHLHLSGSMVEELQVLAPQMFRNEVVEIPIPPQSFSLLHLDEQLSGCSEELVDLFLEKTILEQVYGFYDTLVSQKKGLEYIRRSDIEKIAEAKTLLDGSKHYMTIEEISRKVGTNTYKLKKLFKKEFNTTLFDYQVKKHLSKAYRLLLETQEPVFEIALQCGYQSVGSFSNAFKREFGIRPSELRKS